MTLGEYTLATQGFVLVLSIYLPLRSLNVSMILSRSFPSFCSVFLVVVFCRGFQWFIGSACVLFGHPSSALLLARPPYQSLARVRHWLTNTRFLPLSGFGFLSRNKLRKFDTSSPRPPLPSWRPSNLSWPLVHPHPKNKESFSQRCNYYNANEQVTCANCFIFPRRTQQDMCHISAWNKPKLRSRHDPAAVSQHVVVVYCPVN